MTGPVVSTEAIIVAVSLAAVVGYHIYFLNELRRHPDKVTLGRAKGWRQNWVAHMVARKDYILAVQSLRNLVTSASFLATTAMLISAGILGFLSNSDKDIYLIHELNFLGEINSTLITIKLLALLINFLLSFFNFSMCIRYYNYVAILIPIASSEPDNPESATATRYFARGAMHYAVGMRGYYYAVPLVLWMFGPVWFALGSVLLLVALYRHDHAW
jgi:uncharacterized membrane protein